MKRVYILRLEREAKTQPNEEVRSKHRAGAIVNEDIIKPDLAALKVAQDQ